MKKFLLLALLSMLVLSSCSKGDENKELDIDKGESKFTIEELSGVWESSQNDLLFISINNVGKISYCFNEHTMGNGYGQIKDNELIIQNDYSVKSDKLQFTIDNDTLTLSGDIRSKFDEQNYKIELKFKKVNEMYTASFIGDYWKPLSGLSPVYGSVQTTLSFVGDNTVQYKYYAEKTGKVIKESLWYYLARNHWNRGKIIYVNKTKDNSSLIYIYDENIHSNLFK